MDAHVCEMCRAVTLHWVRWQNWRGDHRYFCDNDCLAHWLDRNLDDVLREIELEMTTVERPR